MKSCTTNIDQRCRGKQEVDRLSVFRGKEDIGDTAKIKSFGTRKLEPIFKRDALYVNLQYGDIREELKYLREQNKKLVVFDKLDFQNDIDDWVAIAAACDGISVSTALVHFAGAIGQKVAVVMPGEQGPCTFGLEDTESFAYKNVRIYRPSKDESLQQLIERVAKLIT